MERAKQFSESVSDQRDNKSTELKGNELSCSVLIDHVNNKLVVILYNKLSNQIRNGEAMDF